MPKVTIVISTYDRPEYLPSAIRSVLDQTFQDFGIIIFDSGSNYDIRSLISSFNDSRITLQTSEQVINGMENFKRIFSFKYESEYLMVFHDDDIMHPQLIERELILMEKDSSLVWVGTSLNFVHDDAKMNNFCKLNELKKFKICDSFDLVRLLLHNFPLAYNTVMYRSTFVTNVDDIFPVYYKWSDRPFLINLSKKGKVAVIEEKLVNYRIHHGQDSYGKDKKNLPYLLNLCNYYKDNLPLPLNTTDEKLFYMWSSNNLLKVLSDFCDNFKAYLNLVIDCRKNGLIRISCLNFRGIWYVLNVFKKYFFN